VFLLRAGFSKAVSHHMPLTQELGGQVAAAVARMEGEVSRTSDPLAERRPSAEEELAAFQGDVERWLSHLAEPQPWLSETQRLSNRARFERAQEVIAHSMQASQVHAYMDPPPPWLVQLIRYWVHLEATVLTFNYDCLVEAAYDHVRGSPPVSWRDLYVIPVTPVQLRTGTVVTGHGVRAFSLLKLRGSTNWYYSPEPNRPPGDPVYDVGIGPGWGADRSDNRVHDRLVEDKRPVIVPPTLTKTDYYSHDLVRAQWREGADALRSANELVVMGYSAPAADFLARTLLTTCFDGTIIVPVDTASDVTDRLRSIVNSDRSRVVPCFTGAEEPVRRFVEYRCNVG